MTCSIKKPEHWIIQLYGFYKRNIPFSQLVAHIGPANTSIEVLDSDEEVNCMGSFRHHNLDYMIKNELALKINNE